MTPRLAFLASAAGLAVFAAGCSQHEAVADASAPPAHDHKMDGHVDAAPAAATPAATTIADFTLTDNKGVSHTLYAIKDAPAIVIIMQGVGCPIVQKMTPDLKAVEAAYKPKGVQFFMLNSNIQDKPDAIAEEAKNFENDIPILKDADQKVGMQIGAVRTAETFVIDPKTWKIVYHGPLNDRLTYGREKAKAENNFTSSVLDAVLASQPVPAINQQADGCIINFPNKV